MHSFSCCCYCCFFNRRHLALALDVAQGFSSRALASRPVCEKRNSRTQAPLGALVMGVLLEA